VARSRAIAVRIGYGGGKYVADGRGSARSSCRTGAEAPLRGRLSLRPHERVAAVLAGRDPVLTCEELVLRARSSLDAERWREAAMQLGVALDAVLAKLEPWREQAGLSVRLDELAGRRAGVQAAAAAALQGGLELPQLEVVREVLGPGGGSASSTNAGGG
jgi:hypothetical protein